MCMRQTEKERHYPSLSEYDEGILITDSAKLVIVDSFKKMKNKKQ